MVNSKYQELNMILDKIEKEIKDQHEKKERAHKSATLKGNNLKSLKINLEDNNPKTWQVNYEIESNLTKTLLSALL